MKKLMGILLFFLLNAQISFAQKPRVWIADIAKTNILSDEVSIGYNGETMPLVFLYNPEIYDQLVKKIPADKLDYIIKYSRRENYPAGLRSFSYSWHNEALKSLYFYFVTYLELKGKTFALLEMPAAENSKMPEALRPQNDIYILAYYFSTNPNYDVGGKKQYKHSIVSQNEKLANEFVAFRDKYANGMIDATLYFKNTVPVSAVTKADYVKDYEAALAIVAKKDKAAEEAYVLRKQQKEAEIKRQIDSLKALKAAVLKNIEFLSASLISDYNAGNFAGALTRFEYWKIPAISQEMEIEAPGVLNKEIRRFTVTSQIHFSARPGGVSLVDETKFSATMNTNIGRETHTETFLHGENFIQKGNTNVFNNEKGDRYLEDAFVGNNQFTQDPWNYFAEYISKYNNLPVTPSFKVVQVEVDPESSVYTLGVKMKTTVNGSVITYTPVDIFNELYKVSLYNLQIENRQREL